MGYGGRTHHHHHHHHHHRGRGFRHRRRGRFVVRFGHRRRYHYGVHHVYHTRAYYVGAENATQPPPQPPYVVIFETQSQFQKIRIVEFTNQPVAVTQQPQQLMVVNTNQQQGTTITAAATTAGANANPPAAEEPPPYNPDILAGPDPDAMQPALATTTDAGDDVPFGTQDSLNEQKNDPQQQVQMLNVVVVPSYVKFVFDNNNDNN